MAKLTLGRRRIFEHSFWYFLTINGQAKKPKGKQEEKRIIFQTPAATCWR